MNNKKNTEDRTEEKNEEKTIGNTNRKKKKQEMKKARLGNDKCTANTQNNTEPNKPLRRRGRARIIRGRIMIIRRSRKGQGRRRRRERRIMKK